MGAAGALDLRMLRAFVPGAAFAGRATVDLRAQGTLAQPDFAGQLAVIDAEVVLRDQRLAIEDLDASATLTRDHFLLHGRRPPPMAAPSKRPARSPIPAWRSPGGEIAIVGRGLAIEVVEGLRTEADADLTLAAAGELYTLTGKVTIQRGEYREPLHLTEHLFSGRAARTPVLTSPEPRLLDRVRLNIAVVTADDLIVDNNYGRLDVGGSIAIIGTAGAPAMAGRLAFREGGRVFLGGQTYTLRRGAVDFTNPSRIEPVFDLSLETRVQSYDLTLDASRHDRHARRLAAQPGPEPAGGGVAAADRAAHGVDAGVRGHRARPAADVAVGRGAGGGGTRGGPRRGAGWPGSRQCGLDVRSAEYRSPIPTRGSR